MEMETEAKPQEQSQEMPLAEPHNAESSIEVESSIPTPSFTPQPETVENSPSSHTADEAASASNSEVAPSEPTTVPSSPSSQHQSQSTSNKPHDKAAPPPPQIKRRPRRTGQPLHLLLQDCSRQHIMGSLCKKTPEEITAIITDKKALAADLQVYSNEFVLTSARDKVVVEVDEQGKELLKDVSPETEVIKQRFEDESSVFKSYEDAMHDIRVDLYHESLKPRKQESDETPESTVRTAELNAVLQVWDQHHKRIDIEPRRAGRSTQSPYPSRGGRPIGLPGSRPYSPHPSSRGPPPAHYGAPYPPPRAHHRDYVDRPPYRDEYYTDRRDDYRREYERHDPRDHPMGRPPVPAPMGRPDAREPRDFRDRPPAARGDHPYVAGARFDDRRRDRPDLSQAPAPRDRHAGGAPGLSAHPSLPPKPHNAFDSSAQPQANVYQQPQYPQAVDPAHAAYYAQQQQAYAGQDYSAYPYGAYPQDPAAAAYYGAQGWDMTGATANAAAAAATGLLMQSFNSVQHGRHKAVPLPTDFMSGPSEAPRLSMPEPHQVLGTIHGVIIRDAHGNIGLSQYQFTQAK
ncbi:hypothetical protein BG005_006914 [Podila minutissima]|nr:hypothetical protein BG005_006914 [Podila minutissima]